MLLKHGRICSRIVEKSVNTSQQSYVNTRCHSSFSLNPECIHRGHHVTNNPARDNSRLHGARQLSYTRGADSDKAIEFLSGYNERTMKKYGLSKEETNRDKTSMQSSTQCRVIPKFLQNAQFFNGRHYFCNTDPKTGKKQLVRYRMSPSEDVTLCDDLDSLAEVREVMHCGGYLAVLVSSDMGSRIVLINEETGTLIKTLDSGHQMQWTSDSSIIYTTINTNLRPDTALFLNLETGEQHTVLQSCREDEVVSVTCSKDKKLTAVNVNTKLTSHVYLVGDQCCGEENLVHHPLQNSKCYIDHHGDRLIAIKSSADNPNLHLYWSDPINKTPESVPTYPKTETFSTHPNDFGVIHELEAFDRGIVVYHSTLDDSGNRGNYRVTLLDPEDYSKIIAEIPFPADVSLVSPNSNSSPHQTHLNIKVHSLTKPVKQLSIPFSKFQISRGRLISRGRYEMFTDSAPSGQVNVPITIIANEDSLPECTPCLFITYGCYGESLFYSWETLPRELLDKNWKVVLCHVRGGGELGRNWYLQGIGTKKENSVLDTLNCIKHVQSLNLTTPSTSTLHASSSGALIAARAAQSVPGIVSKLVLRFPFLDLHTAMLDPSLPLSSEEKEEWGYESPDGSVGFRPLDLGTVDSGCDVFITTADKDRRAPPWHTANYVASIVNQESVFVNLLGDADHTGYEQNADAVETNFISDDKSDSKSSSLWERLKERVFSK